MFGNKIKSSGPVCALGIDIGQCALKAIVLEQGREGVAVRHAARVLTPPGAVQKGVLVRKREVAAQIRQIVRQADAPLASASLAIPTDQVFVRWIDLPRMDEDALQAATPFEARKYLPYSIEKAEVVIVPSGSSDGDRMRALLAAAPRDVVRSRAETLEMAGLEVAAIEIEPLAFIRALHTVGAGRNALWQGQPIVHVHLGEEASGMCVVQDMNLRFVHAISWGSSRLTQMLATALECSPEEAQALKESEDASIDPEGVFSWGQEGARQATEALVPEFERLRREIQRLLNYYRSLFPERSYEGILDRLILSGGTANLKGLNRFFSQMFQAEVTVRNPFQSFASHLVSGSFAAIAGHSTSFVVAVGLALGELHTGAQGLDQAAGERSREVVWRRRAA